jgi:BirA family biotin operon repressor/biotin-[acetyl-CoA-carboxylase] ligase
MLRGSPPADLGPVRRFDEIDSTNRYLADEARAGAPHGLVAVARHQTAGRGRLGRTWEAPPGQNLLMSVLLRPDATDRPSAIARPPAAGLGAPEQILHSLTLAVALSAADACLDVAGVEPGLKWPNDLVVDDLKLAGVLAEAVHVGSDAPAVVVGLGLNVGWPGRGSDAVADALGATSLARLTEAPAGPDLVLEAVLEHLARRITDLFSPDGPRRQAEEYARRCTTIGRQVKVEEHSGSFSGSAEGISEEGHLLVETASGRRVVTAGDVVHLRPNPEARSSDVDPVPAP